MFAIELTCVLGRSCPVGLHCLCACGLGGCVTGLVKAGPYFEFASLTEIVCQHNASLSRASIEVAWYIRVKQDLRSGVVIVLIHFCGYQENSHLRVAVVVEGAKTSIGVKLSSHGQEDYTTSPRDLCTASLISQ